MHRQLAALIAGCSLFMGVSMGAEAATDTLATAGGELRITCLGHASLMFEFNGTVVHVDPWSKQADYSRLPKADLILISHEHFDHLDKAAIAALRKEGTVILANRAAAEQIPGSQAMANGEQKTAAGLRIAAVPAYNIVHVRAPGQPFHPKGVGNGYLLTFGDKRVYVAGDTENTPEMKKLENIDCAFLPMNLPYTMTPDMVADAARAFKPRILYPYHRGDTDPAALAVLLKGSGIDLRIRP